MNLGVSTLDVYEAFEYYKEYQELEANRHGYQYMVQQGFLYAYYSWVGNADQANPYATPGGQNGLMLEFCFDNRLL